MRQHFINFNGTLLQLHTCITNSMINVMRKWNMWPATHPTPNTRTHTHTGVFFLKHKVEMTAVFWDDSAGDIGHLFFLWNDVCELLKKIYPLEYIRLLWSGFFTNSRIWKPQNWTLKNEMCQKENLTHKLKKIDLYGNFKKIYFPRLTINFIHHGWPSNCTCHCINKEARHCI